MEIWHVDLFPKQTTSAKFKNFFHAGFFYVHMQIKKLHRNTLCLFVHYKQSTCYRHQFTEQ